ncbi:SDR family oxidoreductase [Paracoccus ravus]|uniref:SDR family oxidoreductase n=1 Tax=Paracoccus ravus TaxID=2447760 RepID=UPI00106E4893|nr:SDR family oxidoreductase [Paracoccus ravus]
MQLTGFTDRAAFVTGAGGGIGQVMVAMLRASGARVFATDIEPALPARREGDAGLVWQALDVRDGEAVEATVAAAEAQMGPISLGVHAAGVLSTASVLETSGEEWQRVMDTNAGGTYRVTRALGRNMAARNEGAIVVIGSNAGGIPRQNMGAYAASKAAAAMLVRCLGLELAQHRVRCNIVAPGSTLTPMQTGMWQDAQGEARIIAGDAASFRTGIPLGKLAVPEDIAQAAMFLLSDQAGHITMADLYVDGGATLRA